MEMAPIVKLAACTHPLAPICILQIKKAVRKKKKPSKFLFLQQTLTGDTLAAWYLSLKAFMFLYMDSQR